MVLIYCTTNVIYIDTLKWLKNLKSTINPKTVDEKCFQYTKTLHLTTKILKRSTENSEDYTFHRSIQLEKH